MNLFGLLESINATNTIVNNKNATNDAVGNNSPPKESIPNHISHLTNILFGKVLQQGTLKK
eukprot:c41789_g1_i1 orf=83-265(+)